MKYLLITNNVAIAEFVYECGVERIFVDLEMLGKQERQGHLNTLISSHSLEDVGRIRKGVPDAELMVRINPWGEHSREEIENVIALGGDVIMLPMFRVMDEIVQAGKVINGRAGFVPLVETKDAYDLIPRLVQEKSVTELYIGLNDLHLDMGLKFMFEPLSNGMLDSAAEVIRNSGVPFGFGGIARAGEGGIPGEMVLGEHLRLGSDRVILSRTFHRKSETIAQLRSCMDFNAELEKLNHFEEQLHLRSSQEVEDDRLRAKGCIEKIAGSV